MMSGKSRLVIIALISVLIAAYAAVALLSVTLNIPASDTTISGTVSFNATADNDSVSMTWQFYQDDILITNFTASSGTNLTGTNQIEFILVVDTTTITDGNYTVFANASNSSGTNLSTSSTSVKVDNTVPSVALNNPADTFNTTSTTITFNWTGTDNLDTSLNCNLTVDGTVTNASVASANNTATTQDVTFGSDGTRSWNVTCTDNGINSATSSTQTFTIDTANPLVTANPTVYPTGQTAGKASDALTLNATVTDAGTAVSSVTVAGAGVCNEGTVTLSKFGSTNDYTGTCTVNSTSTEGTNALTVTATDILGNTNTSASVSVVVDRTAASISLSAPADTANLTGSVTFTWTATDALDGSMNCNLTVDGTVTNSSVASTNNTGTSRTVSFGSDATRSWNVTCTDNALNSGTSATRTFTVDTGGPSITYNNPSSNGTAFNSDFQLNVTVTDGTGVSTVNFQILNQSNTTNIVQSTSSMTNLAGNVWNASINVSDYTDARYVFRINASDNSGNLVTSDINFTVDDTNPTIISFTLSDTTPEKDQAVTGSCTATDNIGSPSTSITGIDTSTTGSKTATCTATDSAGNQVTSNVQYSVSSSSSSDGGGGGGGGGASFVSGSTVILGDVPAGATASTKFVSYKGLALQGISFVSSTDLRDAELVAQHGDDPPPGTKPVDTTVFQYIRLIEKNVEQVTTATISFDVTSSWLTANNIAENEVALFRSSEDEWTEYDAKITGRSATSVSYDSTVPGLSVFAIGKTKKAVEAIAQPATTAPEVEVAPVVQPAEPAAEQAPEPEVQVEPEQEGNAALGWALAAIIALLIVGYFLYHKKK